MSSEIDNGQRKLGFWMCTALVVGNTIGIGIFLLPASLAPYGFNATIGWLVTVLGYVAIATGVVGYLGAVFPSVAAMQPALVALALLWTFVIINLFGVRTGGRVQ